MNEPMRKESRTNMHEAVKCENCCNWKPKEDGTYGDCYRDPPAVFGVDRFLRPETRMNERCASWTQSGPTPREVELERMLNGIRRELEGSCSAEVILVSIKTNLDAHGFRGQRESNDRSEGETGA